MHRYNDCTAVIISYFTNFVIHEHHIANTTAGTIAECKFDYQPVGGYFTVPELPGIGQDLSERAIERAEIVRI